MKIDRSDKTKRSVKRTLEAFSVTMFSLLEKNALETITVQKLCDSCDYPRSTFYNYFEDIYDLMDYCWSTIAGEMDMYQYLELAEEARTNAIFGIMYDYLQERMKQIKKIIKYNGMDGRMMLSLHTYMRNQIREIIANCQYTSQYPIRQDIVVDFYSGTFEMMLEKCFFEEDKLSKEEAVDALSFLLGMIEKEVHKR